MKKVLLYLVLFVVGFVGYPLIETALRGFSHWTMALVGGLTLVLLYRLQTRLASRPLRLRCLGGMLLITGVELACGLTFNLYLRMNVWSYYHMPGNLWGQICPFFSCLWFLLCIPVFLTLSKLQAIGNKSRGGS